MSKFNSSFFNVIRHGQVVQLEMNRPDKANCMSPDFWEDLPVLANTIDKDSEIVVNVREAML